MTGRAARAPGVRTDPRGRTLGDVQPPALVDDIAPAGRRDDTV
ncbi:MULTISPECIES: hypothetical protein [unclassified Streptomyces]|nr:hypothetical protein [Streptomyces sp. 303MFCol5.2]